MSGLRLFPRRPMPKVMRRMPVVISLLLTLRPKMILFLTSSKAILQVTSAKLVMGVVLATCG